MKTTLNPGWASLLRAVDHSMNAAIARFEDTPARDAALYHLQTGGNRIRARLSLSSAACSLSEADCIAAASACELLHNASLVHDDISDNDRYRRGHLTVQARFGADVAICTGDLLLTAAFNAASDVDNAATSRKLLKALALAAARIIGGQSIEVARSPDNTVHRCRHYIKATCAKTAPLIELSLGLGLAQATADDAYNATTCRVLADAIGLAYQILDDLDDLQPIDNRATTSSLHNLHAWVHHQPPGPEASPARTLRRCLRHTDAALKRADRLGQTLPEPLRQCVSMLVDSLTTKARQMSLPRHHLIPGGCKQ